MLDYESWFLNERGINSSTLKHWNVVCHEDKVEFPYPSGIKTRSVDPGGARTFSYQGTLSLFRLPGQFSSTVFIVEGESDTLKLWQEIHTQKLAGISVVGISGINGWKDSFASEFDKVKNVIVILDNDEGYKERNQADLTFRKIRASLGAERVRRVKLDREGIKDICEFFKNYSWESFAILTSPSTTQTYYKSLDLTKDPTPFQWLLDNWICMGDVALMIGEPGVGKSFISMALAIAVAEGKDTFLGEKLLAHGKVLYVDEENAEDVIYHRLNAMGITDTGIKNIHYYHRQHIRVDRGIDDLLDDAFIIQPKLIVIDSLTRVHSREEKDAGAMNEVFNDGIIPLARETGAAVLVLHHAGKTESNNSFNRARGSSDIGAAIDTGIDVRSMVVETAIGKKLDAINIVNYKSRRRSHEASIKAIIEDTLTGDINIKRLADGRF